MYCNVVVMIDAVASVFEVKRKFSCVFFSPSTNRYFVITEEEFSIAASSVVPNWK